MTQENDNQTSTDIIEVEVPFGDKARALLSDDQFGDLQLYINSSGSELALSTAQTFFELFLHGNNVDEIHRLNSTFPKAAIQWSRIKYDWDKLREDHMYNLHQSTMQKVMKAQLDATSLIADVLSATSKKHGDKLKKFLQSGNEKDLKGALDISNINQLTKMTEALTKITGQDKNTKIVEEKTVNLNVNTTGAEKFSPETSAKIIAAVAEEKRKKDLEKK